jgi:hypothetical protein
MGDKERARDIARVRGTGAAGERPFHARGLGRNR